MSNARDFWLSCGHHFLDRDANGHLLLSDDFLKAYLARPELAPPPEACAAERFLHDTLLSNPRSTFSLEAVERIADSDARENWQLLLEWRDHLIKHPTLESAYVAIFSDARRFAPIFVDQLVQVILRNILDGCEDAFMLRAAEMLFRPQKLTVQAGSLLSADEETVKSLAPDTISPLMSLLGPAFGTELSVLSESNAEGYWDRSDQFDLALDLTAGRRPLAALGEVVKRWIAHFLGIDLRIVPLSELRDVTFRWYLGLDAEATRMGNALWSGEALDAETQARLVGLFELRLTDSADVITGVGDAPGYLIIAMAPNRTLRLKPQNLLTGLPVRKAGLAA